MRVKLYVPRPTKELGNSYASSNTVDFVLWFIDSKQISKVFEQPHEMKQIKQIVMYRRNNHKQNPMES